MRDHQHAQFQSLDVNGKAICIMQLLAWAMPGTAAACILLLPEAWGYGTTVDDNCDSWYGTMIDSTICYLEGGT